MGQGTDVVIFMAGIALYIIPRFDGLRCEWRVPLPVWMEIVAMVVHLPCFVFLHWVMGENTYLSRVVKIDEGRGHQVITSGPYALVRHPMYTAVIVLLFTAKKKTYFLHVTNENPEVVDGL